MIFSREEADAIIQEVVDNLPRVGVIIRENPDMMTLDWQYFMERLMKDFGYSKIVAETLVRQQLFRYLPGGVEARPQFESLRHY